MSLETFPTGTPHTKAYGIDCTIAQLDFAGWWVKLGDPAEAARRAFGREYQRIKANDENFTAWIRKITDNETIRHLYARIQEHCASQAELTPQSLIDEMTELKNEAWQAAQDCAKPDEKRKCLAEYRKILLDMARISGLLVERHEHVHKNMSKEEMKEQLASMLKNPQAIQAIREVGYRVVYLGPVIEPPQLPAPAAQDSDSDLPEFMQQSLR